MIKDARKVGNELDRRRFLRSALIAGGIAVSEPQLSLRALAGEITRFPAPAKRYFPASSEPPPFAPVKVARNRIIREVVGLRPYRSEGFVVEAERLGNKLLVHNYGHGGAGVTLSWGTASLAVDLVRDFIQSQTHGPLATATLGQKRRGARAWPRRFAVLGCGVSGLSTARLLQRRFQDGTSNVTIYAKDLPPETTSNIAGAFWYPSTVFDPENVTQKFSDQFRLACQISNRAFQTLVGTEYGVRWTEIYELLRNESSSQRELLGGAQLYPQTEIHRDAERYFGFPYVRQFSTMMIEPHTYLRALLRDFYVAGGKVVVKEFRTREEIARLAEPVIFNCTGLGAKALFNDTELIPVRGQLEVLLPQPEVDYCYLSGSSYMFPRRDGIILGGTFDHENWSLEPDPAQTTAILEAHTEIMKGLK
ncbi:MAG TPA: FAD-dependent oxidoreductase [Pyrinomonadaceae bacterium]